MRAVLWPHKGVASVTFIKKKTGCWKVLVPVWKRKNANGSDVIAYGETFVGSNGEVVDTIVHGVLPVWQFIVKENQKHAIITPRVWMKTKSHKIMRFRIMELKETSLWLEAHSKKNREGQHNIVNQFILLYKE